MSTLLFGPRSPLTQLTLLILAIQIGLFFLSPLPRVFYLILFLFWRTAYNVGLGVLLKWQSDRNGIVKWCAEKGLKDMRITDKWGWMRKEIEKKMGPSYEFNVIIITFFFFSLFILFFLFFIFLL